MGRLSVIQLISAEHTWGGIEQHAIDVAAGLKDRGYNVMIVGRNVEFFVKIYQEVCPVYTFPIRNSIDPQSILGLARLIRREKVDIIHTHTSRDAWMALLSTFVAGRGKVVTTRHVPLAAKQDAVHRWYYRQLSAVICVSEYVRNIFLGPNPAIDPAKVRTVYPGIDVGKFNGVSRIDIREKLARQDRGFIIGFVGRITREKGLADLIRAVAELKAGGKKVQLTLVGDVNPNTPDYLEDLRELCRELAVDDIVLFQGFTQQIVDYICAFDTLVLPSVTSETFGLVLGEAMACGKPVISTDTGAQREFVQDGVNGYLVPPASPGRLAEALGRLIDNPEKASAMGLSGQEMIRGNFSQKQMLDRIEECYADCFS